MDPKPCAHCTEVRPLYRNTDGDASLACRACWEAIAGECDVPCVATFEGEAVTLTPTRDALVCNRCARTEWFPDGESESVSGWEQDGVGSLCPTCAGT